MHFDLVEAISLAGRAAVPNDDRIGSGDRHAWVIDGATDLGPPGLLGARGGAAWLAGVADAAFSGADAAGAAPSIAAICDAMVAAVAAAYARDARRAPAGDWEQPCAAFAAVAIEDDGLACAFAGDCAILHRHASGVGWLTPPPDAARERARAARLGPLSTAGGTRAPAVVESLRASRQGARRVLGIDPAASRAAIAIARAPVAAGDDLLLMSDGFAALIDAYAAYDAAGLVAALPAGGLAALAVALRAIEAADADCRRHPRFKPSDDASALWLRVG